MKQLFCILLIALLGVGCEESSKSTSEVLYLRTSVILSSPLSANENGPLPDEIRELALPIADKQLCKGVIIVPELTLWRSDLAASTDAAIQTKLQSQEKSAPEIVAGKFGKKPGAEALRKEIVKELDAVHVPKQWVQNGDKQASLIDLARNSRFTEANLRFVLTAKTDPIGEDDIKALFPNSAETYLVKDRGSLAREIVSKMCPKAQPSGANDLQGKHIVVIYKPNLSGNKSSIKALKTVLRFHGSNTIGSKLLPALAEAYLTQEGFANVRKLAGPKEDESFVVGEQNGVEKQIEIQAHGSKTAFEDLKSGICDIGMSSRPIKPEERQALLPMLGDLTSNASEHVLALDGIAVIVHPSNPVKTLTLTQLADIYSGIVTDWVQVGGKAGPITVYARDDKSGTYDYFKEAVLKTHGKSLAANAQRFEDSGKLSESVNNDSAGIGFIGLNYVGSNKVIALSDAGVAARKPSLLTIKTEDYLLSRRLFLYTGGMPENKNVFKFIEFAVGDKAQPVVAQSGLATVDVTPLSVPTETDDPRKQSARWNTLTAGAIELPTHIRFRINSNELDSRANRDIGRIAYLMSQPNYKGKKVILIGFADSSGSKKRNLELSQSRADILEKELAQEGVMARQTEGIGAEAFVVPNDTDEHKEKNRRVEVWVK